MDKVDELFERCSAAFPDGLDDMSTEMLRKFCRASVQIDELEAQIAEEGLFVETLKGPKESPKMGVIHKLSADMTRYYTPLKRLLDTQRKAEAERTEMDEFLFDG